MLSTVKPKHDAYGMQLSTLSMNKNGFLAIEFEMLPETPQISVTAHFSTQLACSSLMQKRAWSCWGLSIIDLSF
jgi:hypothetical protein